MIRKLLSQILVSASVTVAVSGIGHCKNPPTERIDTAEAEAMVSKLAHQPELLRVSYLHYFIGRPEEHPANRFNSSKHYTWYRPNRRGVKYELVQEEPQPGNIIESTLVFHTDDLDLNLPKVESKFGKAPRKYFDQQSLPTEEYSFAPNTIMSFTQKHNTFQVSRIAIHYKGDPLPPPSPQDMAAASLQRKGFGLDHLEHGRYKEGISVLSEHLGENPEDVEAHLALAQAFKANCQINEAIAQYRYTLANSGSNPKVRATCIKDLQDLKVLPSVAADTEEQKHNVNLKHQGQRLRRGSLATHQPMKGSKKSPQSGDNPLNLQPLDPSALSPVIKEPPVAPAFKKEPDLIPNSTPTPVAPVPTTSPEPF